jgi:hypothetical protein
MRHQLRPSIDRLENKTLLSHLAAGLIGHHPALHAEVQRADTTGVLSNRPLLHHSALRADVQPTGTTEPGMAVSLTTSQTTYNPGQVVQTTLTMTNTSDGNETVKLGPSIDGFLITQNGKLIWQSNDGPEPAYVVNEILKPEESITLTADWTGPGSGTGTFVVHNQLFSSGPSATFNIATPI